MIPILFASGSGGFPFDAPLELADDLDISAFNEEIEPEVVQAFQIHNISLAKHE